MTIPKLNFSILLFTLFIVFPTHSMEEQNDETAKKFAKLIKKASSVALVEMTTSIFNKIADEGTNNGISETLNYTLSMPHDENKTHGKKRKIIAQVLMTIQIMEDNLEELDEQAISYIEKLPDEILLLICYQRIQNIITANKSNQRYKEFIKFLSSICLTKKRFYGFKPDLEKYFTENIPAGITDVAVSKTKIQFKLNGNRYIIEDEPAILDQFATNVLSLSNEDLTEIGEAVVVQVEKITDEGKRRQTYEALFSEVIWAPYDEAEKVNNQTIMDKIKVLIKPIFDAFPEKGKSTYGQKYEEYGFNK